MAVSLFRAVAREVYTNPADAPFLPYADGFGYPYAYQRADVIDGADGLYNGFPEILCTDCARDVLGVGFPSGRIVLRSLLTHFDAGNGSDLSCDGCHTDILAEL